ncbi:hypothetical protein FO519_009231 [Halicephalobus sp. NKZ332]|nr:hypothetical protein FO519_009231 [Halicephalobus sp. NKZ332]
MVKNSRENLILLESMKQHFWEMRRTNSRVRVWLKIFTDCQYKGFFLGKTVHHLYKDKWPGIVRNIRKKINEGKSLNDIEDDFLKMKRIVDPLFELVEDEDRKAITNVVNEILKQVCVLEEEEVVDDEDPKIVDVFDSVPEPISNIIDDFHRDIPSPSQHPPMSHLFWNLQAETMEEFRKYCVLQQQYIGIKMEKAKLELGILKKKISEN